MTIPRAVLFDHDGTLVASEEVHFQLWKEVLSEHDVILTQAHYTKWLAGIPCMQNAIDLVERFQLSTPADELCEKKEQSAADFLTEQPYPLMEGVRECLENLKNAGYRMAIVTGGTRNGVQRTLSEYGLTGFFEFAVTKEDVLRSKPHPDPYLQAAQKMGLEPGQCMAIEDTAHGMQSALHAGMRCIAIPGELSGQHDFSGAHHILNSLSEIPDVLDAN